VKLERLTVRIVDVSAAMQPVRVSRSKVDSCTHSATASALRRERRLGRSHPADRRTLSDEDGQVSDEERGHSLTGGARAT